MYNQHYLPGETISKHNDIIRTSMQNIDTSLGQKILACLISKIKPDDDGLILSYAVEVKNFLKNGDGRDYKNVSKIAENIVDAKIELKIGKKKCFYPIFRQIQYDDGLIIGVFNDLLKKYLINLQTTFTEVNLIEYLTLSSVYSQRLFEILKSWQNIKRGFVEIALTDLHVQLNVAVSQKNNFKEFRTKILEKTHKEIINKTNFYFEWEPVKQGIGKTSPVIAIRFIFAKKKKKTLPVSENKKEKFPLVEFFEKPEKENAVMLADKCRKIYGNNCTGGHQKEIVCTLCNLMNKNKR